MTTTSVTSRCEYCDTALEFHGDDGAKFRFTAHDDAFCRDATMQLVRDLRQTLADQRECFELAVANVQLQCDKVLVEAGLPSIRARQMRAALESHDLPWPILMNLSMTAFEPSDD